MSRKNKYDKPLKVNIEYNEMMQRISEIDKTKVEVNIKQIIRENHNPFSLSNESRVKRISDSKNSGAYLSELYRKYNLQSSESGIS